MNSNEQANSEVSSNAPENAKNPNSTKQLMGKIGGVVLAVAVAVGGGAALSEFPNSVAPTNQAQIIAPPASSSPGTATTGNNSSTVGSIANSVARSEASPSQLPTSPVTTNPTQIAPPTPPNSGTITTPATTSPTQKPQITAPNNGAAASTGTANTGNASNATRANNASRQSDRDGSESDNTGNNSTVGRSNSGTNTSGSQGSTNNRSGQNQR